MAALPLLVVLAWAATDAWLESAAGRVGIERTLEARLGMPVALGGEFDVMLWPALGASGTGLVVGEDQEPFADGDSFELTVALRPLLKKQIRVETVRLIGGRVFPGNFKRKHDSSPDAGPDGTELPEIREFILENVDIVPDRPGSAPIRVRRLAFSEFAAGRRTPFELLLEDIGRIDGWVSLDRELERADLDAAWERGDTGKISLSAYFDFAAASGRIVTGLGLPGGQLELNAGFGLAEGGLVLPDVALDLDGQSVTGSGCLLFTDPLSLRLDLAADRLDADALASLLDSLPGSDGDASAQSGDPAKPELPLDLGLSLAVREWRGQGAVLQETRLSIGGNPECPGDPDSGND